MHARQGPGPPETPTAGRDRDDEELVEAALAGDREAAEAICLRYAPLVRAVIRRNFGPLEDVEDIVQETFLSLYRDLAQLRSPRALKQFIVSITLHCVGYELRRRKVRSLVGLTPSGQLPEIPDEGEGRDLAAVTRFYRLLDRLSVRDRTIIVLRHLEGLSLQEVSEALGISLATVKRRQAKASETLAKSIRRDEALRAYLSEAWS